jgi:predicted permease
MTWFGGDSAVLNKPFYAGGGMRTVIGVMRPEYQFPNDGALLWMSATIDAKSITAPGRFGLNLVARTAPGATPEAVAGELTGLARRLPERFGGTANYAKLITQHRAVVRPFADELLGQAARSIWVLFGAVAIVLMIACANVANLFMVRAEGRQREVAIRRAIGAARSQLIRSQMAESVVVAVLAGVLAVALAWVALPVFLHNAPAGVARLAGVHITPTTLLFTLLTALFAALACGLVPAVRASLPDLTRLREGGRGSTRRQHWARDGLVILQTSMALVLLIGSGLLVRSFSALRHVDPGYSTENIFTFQIAPEGGGLKDGPTFAQFSLNFLDRLAALRDVESVGLVENLPLNEGTGGARFLTEAMGSDETAGRQLTYTYAGGDYFKTMNIRVLSGRAFTRADNIPVGNVIISRSAADILFPGKDAVGQRIQRQGASTWVTVLGVVSDVMQYGYRDKPQPLVYYATVGPTPMSWIISSPAYVVKTRRAETIAPEVRALVHEMAPTAPMYKMFTMAGLASDSMVQLSFTMLTLGIASMLALILGAVGLYGVLSYVVAERTREIGVRMALGAEAGQVRRMVVLQGARVVAIGVVIGVGVAALSTRALGTLLFGVKSFDVATFAGMSASMVIVGLFASYVPARRASNVDPIESLRGE